MKPKPRTKKIKIIGRKRSKGFFEDDIEDWMVGQPLDQPDKPNK